VQNSFPVPPDGPAPIRTPLLTRQWLDLSFIRWAVAPDVVAALLPRGTVPDTHRLPRYGTPGSLPNHRPRRPLYRAELITCEQDLVTAAGLPAPADAPVSVLYSPGVPVRLGRPTRPAGIPTP
jgi:uncharacterized protein YqjF (DUF2071 family)